MTPKRLFVITFAVSILAGIILPWAIVREREDLLLVMAMGFTVPWVIYSAVFFLTTFLGSDARKGVMRSIFRKQKHQT